MHMRDAFLFVKSHYGLSLWVLLGFLIVVWIGIAPSHEGVRKQHVLGVSRHQVAPLKKGIAKEKVLLASSGKTATVTALLSPTATPTPTIDPNDYCLFVPVLLYHHVQPLVQAQARGQQSLTVDNGLFQQQMEYLSQQGYQTIAAETLVNALKTRSSLAPKSIVLTFDDGYDDNYTSVYPVLKQYHLIGNFMVPTGLLGGSSPTNSYFSWDQLREMVQSGTVFVYNHTWSHYPLGSAGVEKDQSEVTTAQQQLISQLGKASPLFVYPYGSGQNNQAVMTMLKQQGFEAAFSTLPGSMQCVSRMMNLPRVHIGNAPLASYGF